MRDILLYEKVPSIAKNFSVKIEFITNEGTLRPHWHEHLEILYFSDNGCVLSRDGESFDIKKGDIAVINPNEIHSFSANGPVPHYFMLIWPEFFQDVEFENILLQTHIKNDEFLQKCILNMYDEYDKKQEGYDMQIKAYAYSLMAYLLRNYTKEHISEYDINLKKNKIERISKILNYISDHYKENITTAEIAKLSYLTESYLCRFFKKSIGKSITAYINELRIEKAAVLLLNTDESVTEIATHVGFSDLNYFSRIFKKMKGVSPKEFKK